MESLQFLDQTSCIQQEQHESRNIPISKRSPAAHPAARQQMLPYYALRLILHSVGSETQAYKCSFAVTYMSAFARL